MSTTSQTTTELPLPLADFWLSIDRNGLYNPLVATEVGKRLIVATMEGTRPTIVGSTLATDHAPTRADGFEVASRQSGLDSAVCR